LIRFARAFADELLSNIDDRFPECGASEEFNRSANYLDPAFRGVYLEVLGVLKKTKEEVVERWKEVGEGEGLVQTGTVTNHDEAKLDPTEKLLRARKKSEEDEATTKIQKEMITYESLPELLTNGDRLLWWKEHQQMLPILARAAMEVCLVCLYIIVSRAVV
jgi:hypothetical protein